MKTWKTAKLKQLAKTLVQFQTEADLLHFLRDLCTLEELEEMSSRWAAVEMIHKKIPYRDIAEKTGLSTTTVTRIAHWLHHGEGGYQKALDKKLDKK